jgi:hypothetical protein
MTPRIYGLAVAFELQDAETFTLLDVSKLKIGDVSKLLENYTNDVKATHLC